MLNYMRTFFVVFIFIVLPSILYSTIINIPSDYPMIQDGINASADTDTVLVQPGTYMENINFNGKNITVGSLFFTTRNTTYIHDTTIYAINAESVVTFNSYENLSAVLSGFTIKNGYANEGGGIYCSYSSPSIKNVAITGNTAYYGGGIYCSFSSPSFENITVIDNLAYNDGGGIYCVNDSSPWLSNSILWNDLPQAIYFSYSILVKYSNIEGGWTGIGNIDSDPLFVDAIGGDYRLQSTSPCIDAGYPGSPLDPDGTRADMGAYFYHQYFGPIWHISTTGSDITGNGSEQNPFATIQRGINFSADTDTVLVQPGTYVEDINYNEKNITVASLFFTTQDSSYISSTIIDGNNSERVVLLENVTHLAVLCGFTITNGVEGIYCWYSSPSIKNVAITDNNAWYGGGIHCDNSNPSLQDLTISGNSASASGGGIYCDNSSPSIKNVTISGNSAYDGGGIYCDNSSPSLENVTIIGNTASTSGGGIICYDNSSPILVNSILFNNSPEEINISSGSVTVTYSDIQGQWIGLGNIDSYPLFVDMANGDYHLQSTSPCIDTGDPASPLDPDGTRADMGAYYFHQITFLESPENVTIETTGPDVNISWDKVTGANSYEVYYSDNPYSGFTLAGFASIESWSTSIGNMKEFYYIKASTESVKDMEAVKNVGTDDRK